MLSVHNFGCIVKFSKYDIILAVVPDNRPERGITKIVYNFCDHESRGGKSEHRPTTLASPSTLANRELRRTDRKLRGKQVAGNTRRVNNQRCEQ